VPSELAKRKTATAGFLLGPSSSSVVKSPSKPAALVSGRASRLSARDN
jgi:hypothetical protein